MAQIYKVVVDLTEEEGWEFEEERVRIGKLRYGPNGRITKIDLFRLAWEAYKEQRGRQ